MGVWTTCKYYSITALCPQDNIQSRRNFKQPNRLNEISQLLLSVTLELVQHTHAMNVHKSNQFILIRIDIYSYIYLSYWWRFKPESLLEYLQNLTYHSIQTGGHFHSKRCTRMKSIGPIGMLLPWGSWSQRMLE